MTNSFGFVRFDIPGRVYQFKLSTRKEKPPSFRSNPFAETRRKHLARRFSQRKRDGNILNVSANGNAAETPNIVTILLLHVSRRNRSAET